MKIDIAIPEGARQTVVEILNALLADEYLLYTKTRNYHWNVTGLQFNDLHKFFEAQYEELSEFVDEVAERAPPNARPRPGNAVALLDSGGRPPAEHAEAAHGHDDLAVLVQDFGERAHHAAVRLAPRRHDLGDRETRPQRVARPHGLEPSDLVAAGRAERYRVLEERVPQQAHHDSDRLPAARDETAEHGALSRLLVGVERLRVVLAREGDDLVLRQRPRRRLAHLSGREVLEVEGHAAPISRSAASRGRARRRRP